jgi:hypothetical protein
MIRLKIENRNPNFSLGAGEIGTFQLAPGPTVFEGRERRLFPWCTLYPQGCGVLMWLNFPMGIYVEGDFQNELTSQISDYILVSRANWFASRPEIFSGIRGSLLLNVNEERAHFLP